MDSFLACHHVFPGNEWAVSAARGNRKDAVTASSGAAMELLAVKLPEITTFVQHSGLFFFFFLLHCCCLLIMYFSISALPPPSRCNETAKQFPCRHMAVVRGAISTKRLLTKLLYYYYLFFFFKEKQSLADTLTVSTSLCQY